MNDVQRAIEALLFVAGESVSKKELAQVLECSEEEVNAHLEQVSAALEDHGLSIVVTGSEVSLTTSPEVSSFLERFLPPGDEDLSKAAAETLAIVAYRGPIARYEIDVLRGVDSRRMVRQLVYRGAVQKVASPGKAALYDVTPQFLENMGITAKEDLPRFKELSTHENVVQLLNQQQKNP